MPRSMCRSSSYTQHQIAWNKWIITVTMYSIQARRSAPTYLVYHIHPKLLRSLALPAPGPWLTCLVLPTPSIGHGFLVPVWCLIARPHLIHRSAVYIAATAQAGQRMSAAALVASQGARGAPAGRPRWRRRRD